MRKIQRLWTVLCVLSLIWLIAGCVHHKELSYGYLAPVANPNAGPAVKVVTVTDMRKFEANQSTPQSPTLVNARDIGNRAVMLRAVGRADNGGHKFYFTYLEGRTVETVVRTAVENALRTKGYSVVTDNAPAPASVIPVNAGIRKFWTWTVPESWTIAVNFELEVDVQSPIVLNGGTEPVAIHYVLHTGWLNDAICGKCIEEGLGEFTKNAQVKLKDPK